ncbi:DPP IV N-terminal domain-containing protein [Acidobacteriota bacterium]
MSQLTSEDYARAEQFLPQNVRKLLFKMDVRPHWIGKTGRFWYKLETQGGKEFIHIDPLKNIRSHAFDHHKLAAALSRATKTAYDAGHLPFDEITFIEREKSIQFQIEEATWACDLERYDCRKVEKKIAPRSDELSSPDEQWAVSVKDHNLYLRSLTSEEEISLTTDGVLHFDYASFPESDTSWISRKREGKKLPPEAVWSSDSKRLITHRLDQRKVKPLHLLQYAPPNGTYRPVLHTYRYPFAGDQDLATVKYVIFDVEAQKQTWVEYEEQPVYCETPMAFERVWWSKDSERVYFVFNERGDRAMRLCEVDAKTGKTRVILEEQGTTHIDLHPILGARPNVRDLNGGKDIIWFSERDGWAHLYLYNGQSGSLKGRITSGSWAVREIKKVDETNQWIYFTAGGREKGRDPYYRHLYRAKLDGSRLELLTPEDADHQVTFSPSGLYFIDSYSRVDLPPVSVLRSSEGKIVRILEEADAEHLLEIGWKYPERFCVKARDGITDIYGVIHKPTTFDPDKKYPVIDAIYPGPQTTRTPKSFAGIFRYQDAALAALGFVVIAVDGLGTPFRSKAFHDFSYGNLGDTGGLADHISAFRQLSTKNPYLDLNRVGIYGHSGGGYAAARAILTYPDFYKVAVSSAGNHDARGYVSDWLEKYQGLPEENNYANQSNVHLAKNLKGKLLMACGDMDDNVHPAMTLQLVEALIKANKDFDFLLLPNSNHSFRPHREYFYRKMWDYFVRHLLGKAPPQGIQNHEKVTSSTN